MTTRGSTNYPKSKSSFCNQIISHEVIVAPLYSASMLGSTNVGYLLLFQPTTSLPKENMKPLVDFYMKHCQPNPHSCIHVLESNSWFHKKFHSAKYVLFTLVCALLHPNVAFVVFA
jgi:hypothetical protein